MGHELYGGVSMKLVVSFSGGRTSAYMAYLIKTEWSENNEIVFVFANTGKEREETLIFIEQCDKEWGLGVIWIEAVVNSRGIGTSHRVVNFYTAARNGEPFEDVIRKYGIPNMNYLHCTRELKAAAIKSYLSSIGWVDYIILQGIRSDEPKRIGTRENWIYPLVNIWPTTKPEIIEWWQKQSFDLQLQDHQGNCDACHKKSLAKLVRIATEDSSIFDWWAIMEEKYGLSGNNIDGTKRTFFRSHRSARHIVAMSKISVVPPLPNRDDDAGCSESCEAFTE